MSADRAPPLLPFDRIALFLDLDGTLIEIAPRPGDVAVPPGLLDLLDNLHSRLGGALAVVSGRPLDSIDRLLAPLHLPAAGTHGAELRDAAGASVHLAGEPLPGGLRDRLSLIVKVMSCEMESLPSAGVNTSKGTIFGCVSTSCTGTGRDSNLYDFSPSFLPSRERCRIQS